MGQPGKVWPPTPPPSVFEHQETYTVTVTESFLNYVNDGLLSVEVGLSIFNIIFFVMISLDNI